MTASLLLCSMAVAAQSATAPPLLSAGSADSGVELARTMKGHMVSVSQSLWRGTLLLKGETETEVHLFDSQWLQVFADDPVALLTAERARSLHVASMWLFASGAGVAGLGGGMLAWALSNDVRGLAISGVVFLALGLLIEATGSLVFRQAQSLLLDAVHEYNVGLVNQGLPREEQVPLERAAVPALLNAPTLLSVHF